MENAIDLIRHGTATRICYAACSHMPKSITAFTLMELLVVVAIISLLISILIQSLKQAKELAVATNCLAKVKGLNTQAMFYSTGKKVPSYPHRLNTPSMVLKVGEARPPCTRGMR